MADGTELSGTQMTTPAPPAKAARSGWSRGRKILVGCGLLFALAIPCLITLGWSHERQTDWWRAAAIREIAQWTSEPAWLSRERARLNPPSGERSWMSKHLILFQNGDWVAYSSICHKEDSRYNDFWVGRASDGKWYYTTFHFCVGMMVLWSFDQPKDLPSFLSEYSVREFNGDPHEKLAQTWPDPPQQATRRKFW